MAKRKRIIKINCEGTKYINFQELNEFQEDIKSITREDLDKLKESITTRGIIMPGFVWKYQDKWWILDMHQRFKAFTELEKEGWYIPNIPVVEIYAKTKQEAKEAVLVFVSQHGKVDEKKLNIYIKKYQIKMKNLVIRSEPIKFNIGTPKETKGDDEIPEEVKPITKMGDLWELGMHRVLCGDSTDRVDVDRLMDGKKGDMVFTDPPYGVDYAAKNTFLNQYDKGNCIQTDIKNDVKEKDAFEIWGKSFELFKNILNKTHSIYICSPQTRDLMMMMMMMIERGGIYISNVIIWVKNNHVLGRLDYMLKHEPIIYGWLKKGKHKFYKKGTQRKSVWEYDKPIQSNLHPTMKPIALIENAVLNSSLENEIVFDGFLGSGSTLIACEKTGRICYGMEIEPHYCDVIVKRYIDWCKKNKRPIQIKLNGKNFDINRFIA